MQQPSEIYREKIGSLWGRVASVVFFAASLLFIMLFFYQLTHGPVGDRPAPDWFYITMLCLFLAIGLLVTNFTTLIVTATTSGITAGFGWFRHSVPWESIAGYEMDKGSQMLQYGGYGIRFGKRNGRSVLIYNVMGSPVVLIEVKSGRYFGFSTNHPDRVTDLIKRYRK